MSLYKDASLVMIPSAYKDGKLYSIRPTDGSGDFTFSRGSNLAATRVDVNGLIEKGRENLLLQSNSFSTIPWVLNNGATLTSGQAGYDGSSNAWLLTKPASGFTNVAQAMSTSGVVTFSIYAKAGTLSTFNLRMIGTDEDVLFDLSAGSVSTSTSGVIHSEITAISSGWYRCSFSAVWGSGAQLGVYAGDVPDSTAGNIYIQDAQLEAGLVATDYIETGASTAQAGILEDMPRLDYSGSCPALLLEPQRTNLIPNSEYITNGLPSQANTLVIENSAVSPEGVQNSAEIVFAASSYRLRSLTIAGSTSYTASLFFKNNDFADGETFKLNVSDGVYGSMTATINPFNGTATFGGNASSWNNIIGDIEDYGNGWYRVYVTATSIGGGGGWFEIACSVAKRCYLYGLQIESGSHPTSYIPTYGSSVTRSLDSCGATSATDIINQEQGTLFVDFVFDGKQDNIDYYHFALIDSYAQNEIRLGGYNLALYGRVYSGGTLTFAENYTAAATIGQRYKVIIKYGSEGVKTFANGQLKHSGTPTLPTGTMDEIRLTRSGVGTHSSINQSVYFPTALTDSECIALTTL